MTTRHGTGLQEDTFLVEIMDILHDPMNDCRLSFLAFRWAEQSTAPFPGIVMLIQNRHFWMVLAVVGSFFATEAWNNQLPAADETISTKALPVKVTPVFENVEWSGWESVSEDGRAQTFRPILLTNFGDGSNRIVVPTQQGVVHVIENTQAKQRSHILFDLSSKVVYKDNENEEGFLGMAFHPNFRENGELFVYYTTKDAPHTSVISRFRAKGNRPQTVDLASEEEILRIPQPYWNHNGGTIAFGPDGYLYIALGDGGSGGDPHNNGQNLDTLLGKILRIDVNQKDNGKSYAIPADNPFAKKAGARPEIYALGLRNVWRMAFDRGTGVLWAADVGQNLWEEIDIIQKGGNYGWNVREGLHPFGKNASRSSQGMIDPIFEYNHEVGKSITGGVVYRGEKVPELQGKYVYADYVSGKIWALDYDSKAQKVVGNHLIPSQQLPVVSFGEDEQGEVYFMTVSGSGRGIYTFQPAASK